MLLQVYPKEHRWHKCIFFDTDEKQYYNARTDIYLSQDDILCYKLRPIELIGLIDPTINNLQGNFFTVWDRSNTIRDKVLDAITRISRIYPSTNIYDEPAERLALEVTGICKSLCPTQTWSSQSDVSAQQD